MSQEISPGLRAEFRREFVKGIALQFVRYAFASTATALITKGLLTSGQWELLATGVATAIVTVVWVLCAAIVRHVRMRAARALPESASTSDVRQMGWQILGQLISNSNAPIIPRKDVSDAS